MAWSGSCKGCSRAGAALKSLGWPGFESNSYSESSGRVIMQRYVVVLIWALVSERGIIHHGGFFERHVIFPRHFGTPFTRLLLRRVVSCLSYLDFAVGL